MFKNFIIVILVVILCSLFVQRPDNIQLVVSDLAETKELVVDGVTYVKKTFEKEFSEVVVESTEDDPFSLEKDLIKEETFLLEKDLTGE